MINQASSLGDNEELTAEIFTPAMVRLTAETRHSRVLNQLTCADLNEEQSEGYGDPSKRILDELERNYIFQNQAQSKQRIAPILKKEIKTQLRLRTLQRPPVNHVPVEKRRELAKLALERQTKEASQKQFLIGPVEIGKSVRCVIRRDKVGLFELGTTYRMYQEQDQKFLLAAKRSVGTTTTYLISMNQKNICERDNKYRGKVSSNFIRKEWMIYDDGFNPTKVRELSDCRKQLGYVSYQKKLLSFTPRQILVAIPSLDFSLRPLRFQPLDSQNAIKQSLEDNNGQILKFQSRNPQHTNKGYKLNFGNRIADETDQKNFILTTKQDQEVMALGIRSTDEYYLQVRYPFSLFQAFAIALTDLDPKLFFD